MSVVVLKGHQDSWQALIGWAWYNVRSETQKIYRW